MKYRCVNEFHIEIFDKEWMPTGEYITITAGTIWELNNYTNNIGGEVHLDNIDDEGWIEIPQEKLEECFEEIQERGMKHKYLDWLSRSIEVFKIDHDTTRLTLPYLDAANDCIEIYIREKGDGYLLTDDGETLALKQNGIKVNEKAKEIMDFSGVSLGEDNEITMECCEKDLPEKIHMFAMCLMKLSEILS